MPSTQTAAADNLLSQRIRWAAMQAPSAENHLAFDPVWSDPVTLELQPRLSYRCANRQTRFLADISAGAMVENIRCSAAAVGYGLSQVWLGPGQAGARARLRLEGLARADGLEAGIAARCTNRRPYDSSPLPGIMLRRLAETGQAAAHVAVSVLDPAAKSLFAQAAGLAEGARLRAQVLHDEMFAGIRFDAGWSATVEEGIPLGSLEVEFFARPGFTALRSWAFCCWLAPLGVAAGFGWRSGTFLTRRSGGILIFSSDADPAQAAPAIGQAMQRVWLQATILGLAVQPLPASAVFALPWWNGVPEGVQPRLQALWARILPGKRPLMALRLGLAKPPSQRAGRPQPLG